DGGIPNPFKFFDSTYSDLKLGLNPEVDIHMGCDEGWYRDVWISLKQVPPKGRFEDDAVKLDPKHNKVLFENERVRVVRIHFPPGEEGPIVDKRPRVIILLSDTHAQVRTPDGKVSPRDSQAGSVQWSLGGRQATINGTTGELDNIVVELKSPTEQP